MHSVPTEPSPHSRALLWLRPPGTGLGECPCEFQVLLPGTAGQVACRLPAPGACREALISFLCAAGCTPEVPTGIP